MAAFESSFQNVEERKGIFYLVASWDSRFWEEQAGVSTVQLSRKDKCLRLT